MEEAKGVVKHVPLLKFKEDTTSQQQIDQIIRDYANLVDLIPPMNSFVWIADVSVGNKHQGFDHIFESTFESTEGVAEYLVHTARIEFANLYLLCSARQVHCFRLQAHSHTNLRPLTPGMSYVLCYHVP